ncbi:hypothetical protein HZD82_27985, partial [Pantoea agglomerans]|nr:hypothetical protein [Pantoea agglomerans]
PPQIMVWDKANLQGKVRVDDITETARRYVPEMRAQGADVMYSYLSLVQDDPTVQIVNNAQRAYVEHFIQGDPDLGRL